MKTNFRDASGFTLNEVLVALVVGGLVISFGMSLFVFSSRVFHSWQKRSALRQTTERAVQRLAYDVMRSKGILSPSGTSLSLESGTGHLIRYTLDSGRIVRGEDTLDAEGIATTIEREDDLVRITGVSHDGAATHVAAVTVSAKQNARARFRESNRN